MRFSKHFIFSFSFIFLFTTNCYSFDAEVVHPNINEAASNPTQSILNESLIRIGLPGGRAEFLQGANGVNQRVFQWIRQGGTDEDIGFRALNHFHDPTQPWDNAGLWGEPIDDRMSSSLVWAQEDQRNNATWNVARMNFYQALTTGSKQEYAETFLALGQIMHLVSDKAVPAHVRNDAHLGNLLAPILDITHFEIWTAGEAAREHNGLNYNGVGPGLAIFSHAVGNQSSPISALWDTDRYNITNPNPAVTLEPLIGLAEYTNANFFSEDTAFSRRYPFPHYPATDITVERQTLDINDPFQKGRTVPREYWIKNDPSNNSSYRLMGVGYHTFSTENLHIDGIDKFETLPPMDDSVFADYAARLIPRAVGYSAALIDYFFRGRMDIQEAFFVFGDDQSITGIRSLQVQNITSLDEGQTIETFGGGELRLAYFYTPNGAETPVYHFVDGWSYQIPNEFHAINSEHTTLHDIVFDIGKNIPQEIDPGNVNFLLIYIGQLGNEENGIAVQPFTGTVERIAFHHQPGGQPNYSNIFTIGSNGADLYQLTEASEATPWFFSPAWSRNGEMMAFENHYCTETDSNGLCPSQNYFRNIVVVDLLSELKYPGNILHEFDYDGAPLAGPKFSPDGTQIAAVMQNTGGFGYYCHLVVHNLETSENLILNPGDDPNLTDLGGSGIAWSPVENKIVYYLNRQYNQETNQMEFEGDLFLVNSDGTGKIRLTNDDFYNTQPSWSPDGEWIVFSSDRDGEESMDIWRMDKNGENHFKLVDCSPASCYSPTFSPDGQLVAFSNGSSIYTVQNDGSPYSIKEIAYIGSATGALSWSPVIAPPSLEVGKTASAISVGQIATISWETSKATEVTISNVGETQPLDGSINVSPYETTTYLLTATGPSGVTKKAITITVLQE